ncbi:MAG: hemolysin III family protein [Gemmatimonadota bacterium]
MGSRPQSTGEEIANSVVHGAALVGSIIALPVLVVAGVRRDDTWFIVGGAVFGATLILLYLASTLYHAWKPGPFKQALRVVDHSAIYLLIAGSYTPFMLGPLRGPWGWSMLTIIWVLAALGVIAKWTIGMRFPRLSTILYLGMGWLIVVAVRPFLAHVSPSGVAWLAAGGLCYTAGVAFYVTDTRIKYGHALWHAFVAAGSCCHFFAILWHAGSRPVS